ncbi:unnamed protein product, partial [Urochloa humidicola]
GYEILLVGPACQYLGQQPMYPVMVFDCWLLAICKQRSNQRGHYEIFSKHKLFFFKLPSLFLSVLPSFPISVL